MLDILEDERWSHIGGIAYLVIEWNGVAAALHGLQAHDLPSYLLFLDWFKHFDDHTIVR